jgi:hypothetical protein
MFVISVYRNSRFNQLLITIVHTNVVEFVIYSKYVVYKILYMYVNEFEFQCFLLFFSD